MKLTIMEFVLLCRLLWDVTGLETCIDDAMKLFKLTVSLCSYKKILLFGHWPHNPLVS